MSIPYICPLLLLLIKMCYSDYFFYLLISDHLYVMNVLNPIKELYNFYLEEGDPKGLQA